MGFKVKKAKIEVVDQFRELVDGEIELLRTGHYIPVIKAVRDRLGIKLGLAKRIVDRYRNPRGPLNTERVWN